MSILAAVVCLVLNYGPIDNSFESKYGILEEHFSEAQISLICEVVESEASICTYDSKKHVISVILNRYDGGWGSIEYVLREGQFSHRRTDYTEETREALLEVWADGPTNNCFYFCRKKHNRFCGGSWSFYDGYHNFYERH